MGAREVDGVRQRLADELQRGVLEAVVGPPPLLRAACVGGATNRERKTPSIRIWLSWLSRVMAACRLGLHAGSQQPMESLGSPQPMWSPQPQEPPQPTESPPIGSLPQPEESMRGTGRRGPSDRRNACNPRGRRNLRDYPRPSGRNRTTTVCGERGQRINLKVSQARGAGRLGRYTRDDPSGAGGTPCNGRPPAAPALPGQPLPALPPAPLPPSRRPSRQHPRYMWAPRA